MRFENPACAGVDPHIFFPPKGNGHISRQAREICRGCPALEACRDFAVNNRDIQYGIWGGLTNREVRAIRGRIDKEKRNAKQAA